MIHDSRLFETLESSRPARAPVDGSRSRIGPDRPAIAPLAMLSLVVFSLALWGAIACLAYLI